MFVSRRYSRTHKLKPAYSLIIESDDPAKSGLIIDCVDRMNFCDDDVDDVNIFGRELKLVDPKTGELDLNSKFIIYPSDNLVYTEPKKGKKDDTHNNDLDSFNHYCVGQQRCGKTYSTTEIATQYKKKFPKNQIILISPINDNKNLQALKPKSINCLDADKAYVNFVDPETKVQPSYFKNSLVIFDDLEAIKDNKELRPVYDSILGLLNNFLTLGRHQGTSVIVIRHRGCDHTHSQAPLRESNWYHLYPQGADRDLKYLLRNYCGFNANQIRRFRKLGDTNRRVSSYNHRPQSVVAERVAYVLQRDDDDLN
jgi:hypothetical protein